MINKVVRVALAVALLMFGTAVFAQVQNGGFETGDFTNWTQFGDTSFNGVCSVSTCPGGYAPFEGTYAAFFGPVGDIGGISQDIATVPGTRYTLSFFLALPVGGTPNYFQVQFGDAVSTLTNFPGTFDWAEFQISDMATTTSTRLTFTFRNDPAYWFLDNVNINQGGTTPEPGTLVLFGSGLLGLAGVIRRKLNR